MIAALLAVVAAAQAALPSAAERLAWMEGDWHCYAAPPARSGPRRFEEYWVRDRRGGMVGVGRLIHHSTRALEHMRIAADEEGRIAFFGSPDGAPPVAFALVRLTDDEAVFENPEHDFPQRVAYRHRPNMLIATVSRIDGSGAQTWRYTNVRGLGEDRARCSDPED